MPAVNRVGATAEQCAPFRRGVGQAGAQKRIFTTTAAFSEQEASSTYWYASARESVPGEAKRRGMAKEHPCPRGLSCWPIVSEHTAAREDTSCCREHSKQRCQAPFSPTAGVCGFGDTEKVSRGKGKGVRHEAVRRGPTRNGHGPDNTWAMHRSARQGSMGRAAA